MIIQRNDPAFWEVRTLGAASPWRLTQKALEEHIAHRCRRQDHGLAAAGRAHRAHCPAPSRRAHHRRAADSRLLDDDDDLDDDDLFADDDDDDDDDDVSLE